MIESIDRMPEVMPMETAAALLDVNPRTLLRAVKAGDLRASQVGAGTRGCWVVQAQDIRDFLELRASRPRQTAPATPPPGQERHPRARRQRGDGGQIVVQPSWGRS